MELEIKRLDHHGRGIVYEDSKIVFVDNALPEEVVEIEVLRENSKYKDARVKNYIVKSDKRVKSKSRLSRVIIEICIGIR